VLEKATVQLQGKNTRLERENAELKQRLGLDYTNSSKNPSTDKKINKDRKVAPQRASRAFSHTL